MEFCNITLSHSSTPYDILGEIFQIKTINYYTHIVTLLTPLEQALLLLGPVFSVSVQVPLWQMIHLGVWGTSPKR